MSINRDQAEQHADQAELTHLALQDAMGEDQPDQPRIERLRVALDFHSRAALIYAQLALTEVMDSGPGRPPGEPLSMAQQALQQVREG